MPLAAIDTTPGTDAVLYLPLGGTGEIGMNLNLYGHDGYWLIVDIGITFGGDAFPEHDVLMADPAFIVSRRQRLAGIVLTHAHEDHVGAIAYLWKRLKCPVYATPFTAAVARFKLTRAGLEDVPLHELPLGGRVEVGPFGVEYIAMTHSIPEPNAVLLTTSAGAVLHTGDWKLDDRPVVGGRYDMQRLRALRREPLLAMVCDSTNAVVPGSTGSEGELFEPLREVVETAGGRVIVTAFASNIARLVTLARVAAATERHFGVIGQAMQRMVAVARATGYWPADLPELVDARHLGYLPPEEVLAACTGSQGEPGSALDRMAADSHRDILLDAGDTVVFSSKLIPGNERPVAAVQARLRALGVELITDADAHVHVSGHPAADDLKRLYDWVQPPAVVPTHGTPRHLRANADIALGCHVPRVAVIGNGDLCRLGGDGPRVLGQVPTGRLSLDADGRLVPVPAPVLAQMRRSVC
ncbi:MAG: ribonuclease J [Thiohalocapsa sp.]|jgi:ribonuclease J|uniref:ribonuclease J n=1 Tax=Thiohalocapsa sp. TaxID=2497641 RepID=UPI0025F6C198|nr:ribonuclease J [Thiohalocapsa sp.]MCG6940301.1 ribonuclease J [Thiohalocapsa sp.]